MYVLRRVDLSILAAPSQDSEPMEHYEVAERIRKLRKTRVRGSAIVHGIVEILPS